MEHWEQYGIVFALGKALRDRRSWAGETHIQKAGYFLQELLNVPLKCRFILYKHGPFSFDLRDTLAAMESVHLIGWEPQPSPYGPSLLEGSQSRRIGTIASQYKKFAPQINFLADQLSCKSVAELERVGTALFVTLDRDVNPTSRAREMMRLKPHINLDDARSAVTAVDRMIAEAQQSALIIPRTQAQAV